MSDGDVMGDGRARVDALLKDAHEGLRNPSAPLEAGILGVDA